jgi:hypothetical protein
MVKINEGTVRKTKGTFLGRFVRFNAVFSRMYIGVMLRNIFSGQDVPPQIEKAVR